MLEKELLIIGGGVAGLTAGIYAQRYGLKATILEKLFPGGLVATADLIENIPGEVEPIKGIMWVQKLQKQAEKFGTEIITGIEVNKIEKKNDGFILKTNADDYFTKAIIIATGCGHKKLGIKGEKEFYGRGVSYCATCDAMFYKDKIVAVVGGGNTALQGAMILSNVAKKVYLIHRRTEFRGEKITVERLSKKDNVEFVIPYKPKEILGNEKAEEIKVYHSETKEEKGIKVDGIFIFVGFEPHSKPFRDILECDKSGFIKVNEKKETNVKGIWAAGDVTTTPLRQVVTAAADGAIAAHYAYEYLKSLE